MRLTNKLLAVGLLALLALPSWGDVTDVRSAILASAFDLDGEAADADQVVASATLADSTSYTIAANPDVCRLVDITVTDADSGISAGVLTIVGTDCWDDALTATFTFAAGGSGVKTLVVTAVQASAAYFKTITSVSNGVLTGEGVGDALTVGYTTNGFNQYPMFGVRKQGHPTVVASKYGRYVDIFDAYVSNLKVTTSGASSTTLTSVASNGAFTNISAGDLILLRQDSPPIWTPITARASAGSVTLDKAFNLPA